MDEKAFLSLKPQLSFSNDMNSLIQFWSVIVVPSGLKSGSKNESENLGTQKVDFYALSKKSIFQWKMGHFLKLKIQVPFSQSFIIFEIGHHFWIIR